MRIKQINDRGRYKWVIVWEKIGEKNEWDVLKDKLVEIGLHINTTDNPFNTNPEHDDGMPRVEYYQEEPPNLLLDKLRENPLLGGISVIDEVNSPIIQSEGGNHRFNIAVLRIVPHVNPENPEEKISEISGSGTQGLDYFKYGSRKYNEEIKKVYEALFDTPTDVEIVVRPRRMVL